MSDGWIIALSVVGYLVIGGITGLIAVAVELALHPTPNAISPPYEDFWLMVFIWPIGISILFVYSLGYSLWVVSKRTYGLARKLILWPHHSFEKTVRATAKLFNVWGVKPR